MEQASDTKRQNIKNRITAAQERQAAREGDSLTKAIGDRAVAARDSVTNFAKDHPVATVAGGVVLGVLVSAMFRNSPTRRAGRYASARAAGLASVGAEVATAMLGHLASSAGAARQAGADKLEEAGDAARTSARTIADAVTRAFTR